MKGLGGTVYSNDDLMTMKDSGMLHKEIVKLSGLTYGQVRDRIREARERAGRGAVHIPQSNMPRYDKPLTVEGNALVIGDLEVPFHHADFVNRCLDLSHAWGIDQLILAGDIMHFESFSAWGA